MHVRSLFVLVLAWVGVLNTGLAQDQSPPLILQWFESRFDTMTHRLPDAFTAGYGTVWIPPPGRATSHDGSVGYDPFDRFDLGHKDQQTLYGTEEHLREFAKMLHRAGGDLHVDFVLNHNGERDLGTDPDNGVTFAEAGGYPGFVLRLPNAIDGDFHSGFARGAIQGRLTGLDIDHSTNHRFIRNPVPGFTNNLPAGTKHMYGKIANIAKDSNRRFYPDKELQPILLFDPRTGERDIKVHPFNSQNPMAGDPVPENAMGYLMRNAQWLVQEIGVDGFRLDATKHVEGWVLDLFDRAVYRSNPRKMLDGSTKHVFSYCETFDSNHDYLFSFIRKTINPNDPGRIGANRDVLDFSLYFKLRENLSDNGFRNDWRSVIRSSIDIRDDGKQNGSAGVKFVLNHDKDFQPSLTNVAHAYVLMLPGNAIVYFNAKQFDGNGARNFPKPGRGDALGGKHGDILANLARMRQTHGRGNYQERLIEKELFAYERQASCVVLLNNRTDAGFDSRTVKVDLAPNTHLIELTGNADNAFVDPGDDIKSIATVNPDQTINVRFPRNSSSKGFHGRGYLVYGLAPPQAPNGLELTNVDRVEKGEAPQSANNATSRLTDIHVIKANSFTVKLKTVEVNLLGSIRDEFADGDNALLKVDGGVDVNGNGHVDFTSPGTLAYGFERFVTKSNPRIGPQGLGGPRGSGEFEQTIDATKLEPGLHFIEVRAFRHRTDKGPEVFSRFTKVIRIERP